MRVSELLSGSRPSFSFEFFPPKTEEGLVKLFSTMEHLAELEPSFVSVTYGAGGKTRGQTVEITRRIKKETGLEPVAHLTCRGHTRAEVAETLAALDAAKVQNVLALRGDPPQSGEEPSGPKDFTYADELVTYIQETRDMCVGAACHPEGHLENPDKDDDLERLAHKVSKGVDYLITQLFFDNSHYFNFVRRARGRGVSVPIIPGIMPVTNVAQLKRFTQMCGASVPLPLMSKLEKYAHDDQAVMAIGIEWAIKQCRELLALGAPGIHFYTLNRSLATRVVCVGLRAFGA